MNRYASFCFILICALVFPRISYAENTYADTSVTWGCTGGSPSWLTFLDGSYKSDIQEMIDKCGLEKPVVTIKIHNFANLEVSIINYIAALQRNGKISIDMVILDSLGGDVEGAMLIGDLIFEMKVTTAVPLRAKCYSACVLAYVGGKTRLPFGDIGVHRPRFVDEDINLKASELSKKYEPIFLKIGNYLEKYLVSGNVLELMRSTPSSGMRVLSGDELVDFGLSRNVLYEEIKRQNMIRGCGSEYVKDFYEASNQVERICEQFDLFSQAASDCVNKVFGRLGVELSPDCISK